MLQEAMDQKYLARVIAYNDDMAFIISNILTTAFMGKMASFGALFWIIAFTLGVAFIGVGFYSRFVTRMIDE